MLEGAAEPHGNTMKKTSKGKKRIRTPLLGTQRSGVGDGMLMSRMWAVVRPITDGILGTHRVNTSNPVLGRSGRRITCSGT